MRVFALTSKLVPRSRGGKTAAADLDPDPNSAGGVHIAGLGGLWQAVLLGFAGLDLMGETLGIEPKLPPQ
jgi:trehalose/maltose hydrolase-like predicted phosphorylase